MINGDQHPLENGRTWGVGSPPEIRSRIGRAKKLATGTVEALSWVTIMTTSTLQGFVPNNATETNGRILRQTVRIEKRLHVQAAVISF